MREEVRFLMMKSLRISQQLSTTLKKLLQHFNAAVSCD